MRILITGGAGSIGSECARRLLIMGHVVRVLDVNEEGLWLLGTDLPLIDCMLGDVQFSDDLISALQDMDAVIHCAAYKHVNLCERNPIGTSRVNADAVLRLMQLAAGRRVVLLSTDKAVAPHCAMGRSKRLAEITAMSHRGNVVRFGNVLGSRGSLVPAVIRYRDLGRPIPITDNRMTRFFMGVRPAVDLILAALDSECAGEVFCPSAPRSARLLDFLQVCRDLLAPGSQIERVGARPGERMHEMMDLPDGRRLRSDDPACLMDRAEIEAMLRRELPGLVPQLSTMVDKVA